MSPPSTDSVSASIEELGQDVPAAGADRLADADLAGPLGDRDEHDVHDPDAADDQRDRGDPAEQQGQRAADGRRGVRSWVWSEIVKSSVSVAPMSWRSRGAR